MRFACWILKVTHTLVFRIYYTYRFSTVIVVSRKRLSCALLLLLKLERLKYYETLHYVAFGGLLRYFLE
jgi:hypothetical protein